MFGVLLTAGDCDYEERAGQGQGASSGTAAG